MCHKVNARIVFNDGTVNDYVAGGGQSAFGCYISLSSTMKERTNIFFLSQNTQ